MSRSESNGPCLSETSSIGEPVSLTSRGQSQILSKRRERARIQLEREQERNKELIARKLREIFGVDLVDYEQHQPDEGVYCINFEALEV